ncbi:hypothetical protein Tsp_05951 [Trichinella spiralis]|nr:hypothetical protein Tsp_05951 [Trichinella spiralis]
MPLYFTFILIKMEYQTRLKNCSSKHSILEKTYQSKKYM